MGIKGELGRPVGRPKGEPTKLVRVPVSMIPLVKELISSLREVKKDARVNEKKG